MKQMNCQVDIPKVKGLEDNKLTVGRHLTLTCKGEIEAGFAFDQAAFKPGENHKYSLKLIKAESRGPQEMTADMVFYTAGGDLLKNLILSDGSHDISLLAPDLNVESVLKPPPDGKPQEPFGAILPLKIGVPALYIVLIVAFVFAAVGFLIFRLKRLAYYKKLKDGLKQYESAISPENQFYRSIRQAEKLQYPLVQVEKAFRLYNLRAYHLPMYELTNERVLRYFKRNQPAEKAARLLLAKLLSDFEELQLRWEELSAYEKTEFVNKLYRYVDIKRKSDA